MGRRCGHREETLEAGDRRRSSIVADGGGRHRVHRQRGHVAPGVNAATREERWRLHTHGKVNSSPVVADGSMYVSSQDNFLYAVHT
ncbi:PQQ-binding-like beta-propeller repeat protein [Streptomyces canus]|uniref:PQQ-binding-like beta-propeller repeat protein n=1 Tax=Streptomyces canus TaxID=58343 RepID=UPI0033A705DE